MNYDVDVATLSAEAATRAEVRAAAVAAEEEAQAATQDERPTDADKGAPTGV